MFRLPTFDAKRRNTIDFRELLLRKKLHGWVGDGSMSFFWPLFNSVQKLVFPLHKSPMGKWFANCMDNSSNEGPTLASVFHTKFVWLQLDKEERLCTWWNLTIHEGPLIHESIEMANDINAANWAVTWRNQRLLELGRQHLIKNALGEWRTYLLNHNFNSRTSTF